MLNIDFDFNHLINGHSCRISRIEENLNKFELRIDNLTFDMIRMGNNNSKKSSKSIQYTKKNDDPFADFDTFKGTPTNNTSNNMFGDFDFAPISAK